MTKPEYPGTPKWVRLLGFIALALLVSFILLHLTGNAPMSQGR